MLLDKLRSNGTFKKRALWHRPDDGRIPDAFFPYMYHHGPRLILNEANTTSTNTIHRVYFKPNTRPSGIPGNTWRKVCAISILSTVSQLSGELQGRCYGAGVLKHEPSEASRIRLVIPQSLDVKKVNAVFQQVDTALRADQDDEARRHADLFVLQALTSREREGIIDTLGHALDEARRRRRRAKNDNKQANARGV
jgi:adenine-specific DNA-methyltransferase